jgi:hypothetical protein
VVSHSVFIKNLLVEHSLHKRTSTSRKT